MRLLAAVLAVALAPASELVTRDVFLMGTRAHLAVHAPDRAAGLATLDRALRVLEQTEAELSTWRDDSAISTLNRHPLGAPWPAPAATCAMLRGVFTWHRETGGAFDPTLRDLRLLSFDESRCLVTRTADVVVDVGAFGKGEALDRVEAALGAGPWLVDLGGQVSVGGPQPGGEPWRVAIAHPVRRDEPYLQVAAMDGSLSTSGDSERGAHIVDPRTGRPATFSGSVTVRHRSGLAADAISTALYVMGPEKGIAWANQRGIAAIYLSPRGSDVTTTATSAWRAEP
jgi:thiamine biosynthesis lipoprotein